MEIDPISASALGFGSLSSGGSENPFLQLVVTELQNQDPLEPTSNTDFLAQLAQFSTLEQMETLNQSLQEQAAFAQFGQAASMVGKKVAFFGNEGGNVREGIVQSVLVQGGKVFVEVGNETVPLANLIQVFADEPSGSTGGEANKNRGNNNRNSGADSVGE